jgi:site-specific recombinase XerC
MLATGLRIGDAVTIRKERIIKTQAGYSVVLRTAKTGTQVSCPVPNSLAKSLLGLANDTPFWTGKSSTEKCASNWRKIFSRVFKAAGIEAHPHQFRHTFAKRLLVKGVPVGFVASLLGQGGYHGKVLFQVDSRASSGGGYRRSEHLDMTMEWYSDRHAAVTYRIILPGQSHNPHKH